MCGIVGIFGAKNAAFEAYHGLLTLQHRGQDAAGILSYDPQGEKFFLEKDLGLVSDVFNQETLLSLKGNSAIAHTRYATVGKGERNDLQPMVLGYPFGIGMVHNGNVVNYYQLSQEFREKYNGHVLSQNDLEIILQVFSQKLVKILIEEGKQAAQSFEGIQRAVSAVYKYIQGGYAVLTLVPDMGFVAFRDSHGIRPMVMGRKLIEGSQKYSYCFASESVALNFLGYELVRDLLPGELVFIDNNGLIHSKILDGQSKRSCMFEWVYFSAPESSVDNKSVYRVRLAFGKELAKKIAPMIEAKEIIPDVVVPVPETSRISAIALAEELGLPYRELLIKSRYIQRSFILESQSKRELAVSLKLSPVKEEIEGKNILLVDDSIVRGTTSKKIVRMLQEAGAKAVYITSTCPPIKHPCFFGVDFPSKNELVAGHRNHLEIEKEIGADKIIYQDLEGLKNAIGHKSLCTACIDGDYPVDVKCATQFQENRSDDRRTIK